MHVQGKSPLSTENQSAYKQFFYNSQLADWLYQVIKVILLQLLLLKPCLMLHHLFINFNFVNNPLSGRTIAKT